MQSLIGMTQHLVILMTRTSMTLPILEKSWREVEEKSRMKPVLITWHIQFMYLTYHTYNHLLYLQIMDHKCLHYDLDNVWFCKILLLFQVESKTDVGLKRHSCAFVSVLEEYSGHWRPGELLILLMILIMFI